KRVHARLRRAKGLPYARMRTSLCISFRRRMFFDSGVVQGADGGLAAREGALLVAVDTREPARQFARIERGTMEHLACSPRAHDLRLRRRDARGLFATC